MKQSFENILKAIVTLSDNNKQYIIKQLKEINNLIVNLQAKNDSFKMQLSGVTPLKFNDTLIKSIYMLKIFGFTEETFAGFSPDFLNWFFENSQTNTKYNPKLMNYYLLDSMQQSYFICYAENEGTPPTYSQVKKTMLTFTDVIECYKNDLNLDLSELLNKLHGEG